ncbi:MAG: HD domain-containing phosphohydrolase [Thermodesulfobacteriota bacterium]
MNQIRPRIMLVDNESGLLDVCAETLEDMASEIIQASDGLEAIARLEQEAFDIVISDLMMPGAGGVEVLKAAARLRPGTDVIVVTGYGTIGSAVECVKLGAVNYLLKPFKVEDLRAAVSKAVEERSFRRRNQKQGNLSRMLSLNTALNTPGDVKALIKEFLAQIKEAFAPDGIAFFAGGTADLGIGSQILIGPYFREHPSVRIWFETLAGSVASKGRPLLLEEKLLRQAFGNGGNGPAPRSAIGAAVGNNGGPRGAVVALRASDSPGYTLDDLNLLTLFAAHASLCFESRSACARLKSANDEIVYSLVHAVEAKDTYTRGHSERVSRYAVKLAKALGLAGHEVELVRKAGVLHDIGKIGVPDRILNKKGPLAGDEMPAMRQHPSIARTILGKVESLSDVLPIVYHHHERFDGSGYPSGLKGEEIPFLARLISVVDGFEAMTSDRAYHSARSVETAREILLGGAGTQWDGDIVKAWIRLLDSQNCA